MGSRDRKRAERRKRKERSAARREPVAPSGDSDVSADTRPPASAARAGEPAQPSEPSARPGQQNGGGPEGLEDLAAAGELSRSERKNAAAREALVPLGKGERPLVVTLGALASTVLFVAAITGWLLWDTLRDDTRPALVAVLLFAAVVGTMAYGMWRVRYWAVLGFQAVLLFSILGSALGIVRATTVLEAIGNLLVLVAAGALFYFMVKALARIQMPERQAR